MRSFIAIPIPADASRQLATEKTKLQLPPGCRWVEAGNLHITLVFLGEQPQAKLALLAEKLQQALAGITAIQIQLEKIGGFPSHKSQIIAAHVASNPALARLQASVVECVEAEGITLDSKPFIPHITLAYSKRPLLIQNQPTSIGFDADAVHLTHSKQTPQGSNYTCLKQIALHSRH